MVLCFVCALYWLMSWLPRSGCVYPGTCCVLCSPSVLWGPRSVFTSPEHWAVVWLGRNWALPGAILQRRFCYSQESLLFKNYPEGRKEHDRIQHELFLANGISLAWPNTDWSLVGTWKWKWINWHCWRKIVDIPPILFWVHLIGPVYPWLSYTLCEFPGFKV